MALSLDHPRTCSLIVIAGKATLTAVEGGVGLWCGSTALIADAVHSLSDILAGVIVYFGLRIAERPADEDHHLGHGNAETMAATLVAVLLMAMGLLLAIETGRVFYEGRLSVPSRLAFAAALFSVCANEALYRYASWVGRRTGSPALKASASDNRADALSSVAALIGIGCALLGWPAAEPLAGLVIGGFIVRMGYKVLLENVDILMAGAPDEATSRAMRDRATQVAGVITTHALVAHRIGPYYGITVHIEVDDHLTVKQGHDIADEVERTLKADFARVRYITVHVDPYLTDGHGSGRILPEIGGAESSEIH